MQQVWVDGPVAIRRSPGSIESVLRDHVTLLAQSQIGGSKGKYKPAMAGIEVVSLHLLAVCRIS